MCRHLWLFSSESADDKQPNSHHFPPFLTFSSENHICLGYGIKMDVTFYDLMMPPYSSYAAPSASGLTQGQVTIMRVTCNFHSIQDKLIIRETNFHRKQRPRHCSAKSINKISRSGGIIFQNPPLSHHSSCLTPLVSKWCLVLIIIVISNNINYPV